MSSIAALRGIALARNSTIRLTLCLVIFARISVSEQTVILQTWVERALYCKQSNNQSVFQLLLGFTYQNDDRMPVIIPRFGVVAGYTAEEYLGGKTSLKADSVFGELEMISPEIWSGSVPDSNHFVVLRPGEKYRAGTRLLILSVVDDGKKVPGLLPAGQYSLRIAMDHGRGRTTRSPDVDEKWRDVGGLLIDNIQGSAVNIQVPAAAPSITCPEPPVIITIQK
jgi:hypothetical protein